MKSEVFEIGQEKAGQCMNLVGVDLEGLQEVLQGRTGIHVRLCSGAGVLMCEA